MCAQEEEKMNSVNSWPVSATKGLQLLGHELMMGGSRVFIVEVLRSCQILDVFSWYSQ